MKLRLYIFLIILLLGFPAQAEYYDEENYFELIEEEKVKDTKGYKSFKEQPLMFNTYKDIDKSIQSKNKNAQISLKNEFEQSLKIKLKLLGKEDSYKDIFVNPYQVVNIGSLKSDSYQLEIYDVSSNFLGYIVEDVSSDKNMLVLNRLKLRANINFDEGDSELGFEDLQKQALRTVDRSEQKNNNSNQEKNTELNKVVLKRSTIQIHSKPKRAIKVANHSKQAIQIDIFAIDAHKIGNGWTISNRIVEPEYLLYNGTKVLVKPDSKLTIREGKAYQPITLKAKDLNVDEEGNYVLIISQ